MPCASCGEPLDYDGTKYAICLYCGRVNDGEELSMLGPKIIKDAPTFEQARNAEREKAETGIRRTASGWVAIRNGRFLDSFSGQGSKRDAIARAGTNRVIA